MNVSVSWNGEHGDYVAEASGVVEKSPADIRELLTSRPGAALFRDIHTYDTWDRVSGDTVRLSYRTGFGIFRTTVHLELKTDISGILFKSDPNDVLRVTGKWKLVELGPKKSFVTLTQIVRPNRVPAWIPLRRLIRARIGRAFEDLSKTVT